MKFRITGVDNEVGLGIVTDESPKAVEIRQSGPVGKVRPWFSTTEGRDPKDTGTPGRTESHNYRPLMTPSIPGNLR